MGGPADPKRNRLNSARGIGMLPTRYLQFPPSPPEMPAADHQLAMTVLMTPDMANFAGNVHGGTILKFLDQGAYACASPRIARHSNSSFCTMGAMDEDGQPANVPPLAPATPDEHRRFNEAAARKPLRAEREGRYRSLKEARACT